MQAVLLNADFTYLNTVSWKKAVKLIVKKKAEILKAAEKKISNVDNNTVFKMPILMRLKYLVKAVYRTKIPFSRKNLFIRDNYQCQYCGAKEDLTIDHIFPKAKGGKTNFENCVTCCRPCNNEKGFKSLEEFGRKLYKMPYTPTVVEFLRLKMKAMGLEGVLKDIM